jgi:hypothetical protein
MFPDMDNFIQELEEDLRRDRYLALWRKYGRGAVALALVVVIAVAVGVVWRQYQTRERLKDSMGYNAALALLAPQQDGKPSPGSAESALAGLRGIAQSGSDSYATFARFQEAAILSKDGKTDEAVAIYEAMAANRDTDPLFRDLASLLRVLTTLDRDDPQQLTARLTPLIEPHNPWRFSALELTALLAQRSGDSAKARNLYTSLADDPTAPNQLRARATEMLAVLGPANG